MPACQMHGGLNWNRIMSDLFVKLFDTPHGQLLVTKEFDEEYQMAIRGEAIGGASPVARLGYDTKSERDEQFTTIDQAKADQQAATFANMLTRLFKEQTHV